MSEVSVENSFIKYKVIEVGLFHQNTYIFFNEINNEAIIFDPGAEEHLILEYIEQKKLNVKAILLTHAHVDHIGAVYDINQATKAPIYLHKDDLNLYENVSKQAQLFGLKVKNVKKVDYLLKDGQILDFLNTKIQVIHVPGHSPGSCCFFFSLKTQPIVVVGDVLFMQSIGRTDLWGGNYDLLIKFIKKSLFVLDNSTVVLSGHGSATSIGYEKENNPFLIP